MSARDYVEKDYYKALGVPKDADQADIKKAYRSSPGSTTRTPTRATRRARNASRRSPRPTTCSPTRSKRREYDEARTLFGAGGSGCPGWLPAATACRSTSRTSSVVPVAVTAAGSVTCSAASSAVDTATCRPVARTWRPR